METIFGYPRIPPGIHIAKQWDKIIVHATKNGNRRVIRTIHMNEALELGAGLGLVDLARNVIDNMSDEEFLATYPEEGLPFAGETPPENSEEQNGGN